MTVYQIYLVFCFSFLHNCNVVHSVCTKASDSLTHKMCYAKSTMDSATLLTDYNATINAFSTLSQYSYVFNSLECESETDTAEIPSSILTNHACFTCCSPTITCNVDSNEYKHWALLYNINNNIMSFASDLQT
eukprot:345195_1